MSHVVRIGTRESQLAVWQATQVKNLLLAQGCHAELVFIKSEGDTDLQTPLYELGVQGIFTKALDIALLNNEIDVAVHSQKDVPTQLANGILQAAVLPRASYKDLFIPKSDTLFLDDISGHATIATSSTRRKAQWLHRYPGHKIENLRGNVNTRLQKVRDNEWHGAIFAAAGLERICLRPDNAVELDWMLPAPAQGAILVTTRQREDTILNACNVFHDSNTALCTSIERDFLRTFMGGCTTPISALARIAGNDIIFEGNILSLDGKQKVEVKKQIAIKDAAQLGSHAAAELLDNGGWGILEIIRNAR